MSSSNGTIRALHLPFDRHNPYQRRLFEELAHEGVQAKGHKTSVQPLYRQFRYWRADILHYHWIYPSWFGEGWRRRARIAWFFAQLRMFRRGRPGLVWTVHNLAHHESDNPHEDHLFAARMVDAFDACLVHSESAREELLEAVASVGRDPRRCERKLHVVPHGNYDGCYRPARSRAEQRACMGVGDDEILFAFVGQIRPYKNAVELVRAFRASATARGRLGIWGRPLDATIDGAIRDVAAGDARVHYAPGFLPDEELAAAVEACDVVVLPYREFLTSGAAVLAMTYGKPIIAPDRGCFRELLGPTGNPLYDDGSPSGLAGAIAGCCSDPGRLAAIGAANRRAAEGLEWHGIAAQVRGIYDAVIGRAAGRRPA